MGMKCPACGFTADGEQDWCDFCKEPFPSAQKARGKKPDPHSKPEEPEKPERKPSPGDPGYDPPLMPPPLYAGQDDVEPPGSAMRAVESMQSSSDQRKVDAGIPPDFAHLDSGENIPVVSNTTRVLIWAAWVLLIIIVIAGAIGLFLGVGAGPS